MPRPRTYKNKTPDFNKLLDVFGLEGSNPDAIGIQEKKYQIPTAWASVITPDANGNPVMQPADEVMKRYWKGADSTSGYVTDSTGAGSFLQPGFYSGNINLTQINNLMLDNVFLGWGELSLLQQHVVVNQLATVMADSMTSNWIKFHHKDMKKSKDKIAQLESAIKKFNLKEIFNQLLYKSYILGTMYLSPIIDGDEDDLANELFISKAKVKKGGLKEFVTIEPTWVVPIEFNMTEPRAKNFYKANKYVVFGQTIHHTRMEQITWISPVNLLSSIYLFGGQPPIQAVLPFIMDFINTKREVVKLISRYNTSVLNTDLNVMANSDESGSNVRRRAMLFNSGARNQGLFMIDKDEQFTQIQINLGGLTDIVQQQGEMLSLFTRITVSKLFGQAPKGLNATGEFDANNFNELINSTQESKMRPGLEGAINLIQLNEFGSIDPDLEFTFVPLAQLNEQIQSQLKTDKINRKVAMVQAGVIAPADIQEQIQQDDDLSVEFPEMSSIAKIQKIAEKQQQAENDNAQEKEDPKTNAKDQQFYT